MLEFDNLYNSNPDSYCLATPKRLSSECWGAEEACL